MSFLYDRTLKKIKRKKDCQHTLIQSITRQDTFDTQKERGVRYYNVSEEMSRRVGEEINSSSTSGFE